MKNCILYLVHNPTIDQLNDSLRLVSENVLPSIKEECDIILFHEADFNKKNVLPISNIISQRDSYRYRLIFYEITFRIPEYPEEIRTKIPEYFPHPTHAHLGHKGFTIGYRHMCRFFSGGLYELPIMNIYDYYLRLDSDSFIHTKIDYDIFEFMKSGNYNYGYIAPAVQYDNPKVVGGLWAEVEKWINDNAIETKMPLSAIPDRKMYYTNFELAKVSWFQRGGYKALFDHIDSTGGIYTGRWGDAPIKYLGVNLFMPQSELMAMSGFTYQHGAIYKI